MKALPLSTSSSNSSSLLPPISSIIAMSAPMSSETLSFYKRNAIESFNQSLGDAFIDDDAIRFVYSELVVESIIFPGAIAHLPPPRDLNDPIPGLSTGPLPRLPLDQFPPFRMPMSETVDTDREQIAYRRAMQKAPNGMLEEVADINQIVAYARQIYNMEKAEFPRPPEIASIEVIQDNCVLLLLVLDELMDQFQDRVDSGEVLTENLITIRQQLYSRGMRGEIGGSMDDWPDFERSLYRSDAIAALHALLKVIVE